MQNPYTGFPGTYGPSSTDGLAQPIYDNGNPYGYPAGAEGLVAQGSSDGHGANLSGYSDFHTGTTQDDVPTAPNSSHNSHKDAFGVSQSSLSDSGEKPFEDEPAKFGQYAPLAPAPAPAPVPDIPSTKPAAVEAPQVVLSRANRLDWVDGLRGIASVIIFTHHFSDLTWSNTHPGTLGAGSIAGFFRNGQLAVGIYFLVGGRVLAASFLKSALTVPKNPVVHGDDPDEKPVVPKKPPGARWMSIASSLFRRSIRLAFPAIIIGFIQWQTSVNGYFRNAELAQEQFFNASLWSPTWFRIGSFSGFLQFVLDLFTERNHQYMLNVGSALWTTYDQFWGSVLVYILAATFTPLPAQGRYTMYLIVLVALWWINAPNFLYVFGLLLADLHAAGFIRKIQDHWKWTCGAEVCAMALALAFIAGGAKVMTPGNHALASITVADGKFGWDADGQWPQIMLISNWIPACCIILWLELSHAMQWLMSWRIFVWIGKVSYGFYLIQFLVIYGVMPPLVLYFSQRNGSYWGVVTPSYILCLMLNFLLAWIAYRLLDRVGLKLGKWIWDGLFVSEPKDCAHLPIKIAKHAWWCVSVGPAVMYHDVVNSTRSWFKAAGHNIWTLFHWRTVTTRPPVPVPTDPEVLAQLNSTRWTSDLSGNRGARRTHRLLKWQSYFWIPHLFLIPGMTVVWVYFHPTGRWTEAPLTISTIWRFMWILSVPNCIFALTGFVTPDRIMSDEEAETKPVYREYIRNFFVLLVTKGSNEAAVRRGYGALIGHEQYHPALKVVVLTDEPYVYSDLQNIVCPKSYKSPLGKAKYKARALDYFRYHVSLGVYDWILHMDEESTTDAETLKRCMHFVRYTPHSFGQGIILYNGEGYWENWYFTVADGIRVGDDLARFHFQNTLIQRPIFGVHGSFLLTNGELENECTWDFGSLAEDFEFSQDAWRRGFTCGRVHGIVREQSPTCVRDFLKQRRRWFMGIRDIKGMYGLPHFAINLWVTGVFTLAVTLINLPIGFLDYSYTPIWVAILADFCFISFFALYLWGLFFQDLDYGVPWWKIIIHIACAIVIQPFASIAEGLSAIWAMSSEDFGKFEVIVKR